MPSYCSISEAWGNNFNLNKNNENNHNNQKKNIDLFKINNNTLTEPVNNQDNDYMPVVSDYQVRENYSEPNTSDNGDIKEPKKEVVKVEKKCSPQKCKELLKLVLECPECQKVIYDNIRENFESKSSILSNNDILNSVFLGLFIILVLDLFVKIGRIKFSKS